MTILVSIVNTASGQVECSFTADADKYFYVNKEIAQAREFVDNGIAWQGESSYGTHLLIERAQT